MKVKTYFDTFSALEVYVRVAFPASRRRLELAERVRYGRFGHAMTTSGTIAHITPVHFC